MDHSSITLVLNKDDTGFLIGFSLTAVEAYAECFCVTFPFAQRKRKARIEFGDGKIRFIHEGIKFDEALSKLGIYGCSESGTYETDITPADAIMLRDLLHRCGRYDDAQIKFRLEMAWGKGFLLWTELSPAASG